jgi:hypothetical protein
MVSDELSEVSVCSLLKLNLFFFCFQVSEVFIRLISPADASVKVGLHKLVYELCVCKCKHFISDSEAGVLLLVLVRASVYFGNIWA